MELTPQRVSAILRKGGLIKSEYVGSARQKKHRKQTEGYSIKAYPNIIEVHYHFPGDWCDELTIAGQEAGIKRAAESLTAAGIRFTSQALWLLCPRHIEE